ncbi:helix-turn-helix domain-containing protein [Halorussus halophilus]|uniref:helix-turn-helix domain-containing protein n=1 Tax=Halorussus halophilus TaxID=2650975 RepID=UPI001787BF3A|nr:helix-turn-helix domain-containing protein [Halorussus halophilus]
MVVILDVSIPADQFALGRVFEDQPDVEVELEKVVPLGKGIMPLFWISGADPEQIEASLRDDPLTNDVTILAEEGDRTLYQLDWAPEINSIIQPLVQTDGRVLEAEGNAEEWEFRLRFHDRDRVAAFRQECRDHSLDVEILRLYNPEFPHENGILTDEQTEAILTAYEEGYWEVPRDTTLSELATELDISDNSVSQRIRRGISTLVRETLVTDR